MFTYFSWDLKQVLELCYGFKWIKTCKKKRKGVSNCPDDNIPLMFWCSVTAVWKLEERSKRCDIRAGESCWVQHGGCMCLSVHVSSVLLCKHMSTALYYVTINFWLFLLFNSTEKCFDPLLKNHDMIRAVSFVIH